jgi:hypothetical protein
VSFEREEEEEDLEAGEPPVARPMALLAVSVAAVALALLPAAIGVTILVGSTVSLEFAVAACLTALASIKVAAALGGLVAAAVGRTPTPIRISAVSQPLALAAQRR